MILKLQLKTKDLIRKQNGDENKAVDKKFGDKNKAVDKETIENKDRMIHKLQPNQEVDKVKIEKKEGQNKIKLENKDVEKEVKDKEVSAVKTDTQNTLIEVETDKQKPDALKRSESELIAKDSQKEINEAKDGKKCVSFGPELVKEMIDGIYSEGKEDSKDIHKIDPPPLLIRSLCCHPQL